MNRPLKIAAGIAGVAVLLLLAASLLHQPATACVPSRTSDGLAVTAGLTSMVKAKPK